MDIATRLQELGIQLPDPAPAGGVYQPVVVSGGYAYASGSVPLDANGNFITGKVGAEIDTQTAKNSARIVGLYMLAALQAELGSLDRVKRLVKTLGMVNSTTDFKEHPIVINGYSELMRDVFGKEKGIGARSAVGMMLPLNVQVEIEAIFEVE